ncbi:HRDC domain-containing protein [Clostridium gasigenes]|uniref:Nuclease-related domain-containing protein n=1 Tax=Clostridium gasigenes TaxID=94869 RepID=A0A1H0P0X7_9CLOT|nr:HRDC domain-containing protein [Clostridium gasigenes]MBB6625074.1 NERD domain-containing protein [Clostridium gasigenes]MBU3090238.1 NERD domain-containing protein [Clostridium gasigenes]SDO98365.1 Nuclease-related domain-containing protein [Clostridium gasigenes]
MSIIKSLLGIKEIKNTIFYKDFSEDNRWLNELIDISSRIKSNKKKNIDRDIAFLKAGISGEKNVYYELKNSFIPMICLHDIRIEDGDYAAQLDFVVITHKYIMILETKKLNGDILINECGDFIRSIKNNYSKGIKKEGIYSPIAQNDRHVRILKEILMKNGKIRNTPIISGVVIANPKSIVNKTKASKKIKDEIFRYDQLTEILNEKLKVHKDSEMLEHRMKEVADFLIINNKNIHIDYNKKYSLTEEDFIGNNEAAEVVINEFKANKIEYKKIEIDEEKIVEELIKKITKKDSEYKLSEKQVISSESSDILINKLKEYRTSMARSEKVSPYFIYNNETLGEIIKIKPKNKEELMKVRGFGPIKVEKYGDSIIDIINVV